MKIEVTAGDICDGVRGECYLCAIARATGQIACVGAEGVAVVGGVRYLLPLEARAFIDRFDRGERVEPLAFELLSEEVTA